MRKRGDSGRRRHEEEDQVEEDVCSGRQMHGGGEVGFEGTSPPAGVTQAVCHTRHDTKTRPYPSLHVDGRRGRSRSDSLSPLPPTSARDLLLNLGLLQEQSVLLFSFFPSFCNAVGLCTSKATSTREALFRLTTRSSRPATRSRLSISLVRTHVLFHTPSPCLTGLLLQNLAFFSLKPDLRGTGGGKEIKNQNQTWHMNHVGHRRFSNRRRRRTFSSVCTWRSTVSDVSGCCSPASKSVQGARGSRKQSLKRDGSAGARCPPPWPGGFPN